MIDWPSITAAKVTLRYGSAHISDARRTTAFTDND